MDATKSQGPVFEEEYQARLRQRSGLNEAVAEVVENINTVVYSLFYSEYKKYNSYLGFYPNRKVIQINSTGSSHQITRWFSWDCDNASKGHYDINGNEISFTVTSSYGSDDYVGYVKHETLDLWINAFYDNVIDEYIGRHRIFTYIGELKTDGRIVKDYRIDNLKGLWHW